MRASLYTATIAIALVASACRNEASNADFNGDANLAEADLDSALGANTADPALPTDAAGFATAIAASDLFEIESGKLAQQKGGSEAVKAFGKQLETDHSKSTADLKAAAAQSNVPVAPALDAEKQSMLDQLKAASGAEFDRLFVEQQKTAHQKALSTLQGYAAGGDNDALKAFATKAATIVQGHLDHANGMSN